MQKWPGMANVIHTWSSIDSTMRARADTEFDLIDEDDGYDKQYAKVADASDFIVDIREYDVPYHVRVAIDKGLRLVNWRILCHL